MLRFGLAVWTVLASAAFAGGTPDGATPAEEDVCDGYTGRAYGLCTAYCEAMDCDDERVHASDAACASVRRNFVKATGSELPCEESVPAVDVCLP